MPASLKIALNNTQKLFAPGDKVEGYVEVKDLLRQSFDIPGLTIRVVGTVDTYQHFVYRNMFESIEVLNSTEELAPPNTRVTKDERIFKFSLVLPKSIPPSVFVTSRNRIGYKIEASIPNSSATSRNIYVVHSVAPRFIGYNSISSTVQVPIDSFRQDSDQFVHSTKYNGTVKMTVSFPEPGITINKPVGILTSFEVADDLPEMTLQTLRITITEYTKLKAKDLKTTHSRPYIVYSLPEPTPLLDGLDASKQFQEFGKYPDICPNFEVENMSRYYVLSVHAQVAKSSIKNEATLQHEHRLHLNARQEIEVFNQQAEGFELPAYSK